MQLYGVQQELARQQMLLEKEHDNYSSEHQLRQQSEKLLKETKQLHEKITQDTNHQRKQGSDNFVSTIFGYRIPLPCFFKVIET